MAEEPEVLPTEQELIEPARRALAAGMKPWRPGQSGNANGVSKVIYRTRRMFQGASEELAERLIYFALHAEDERVAAMCTIHALGCAGVRQIDFDPASDASSPSGLDVRRLSGEQRAQLYALLDVMASGSGDASE